MTDTGIILKTDVLRVRAITARKVPKMDIFGTCDPFVTFKINNRGRKFKSSVCKGTYEPWWDQTFDMPIKKLTPKTFLYVRMYDYDSLTSNDVIGSAKVILSQLEPGKSVRQWLALKPKGEVMVEMTMHSAGTSLHNPSPPRQVGTTGPSEDNSNYGAIRQKNTAALYTGGQNSVIPGATAPSLPELDAKAYYVAPTTTDDSFGKVPPPPAYHDAVEKS